MSINLKVELDDALKVSRNERVFSAVQGALEATQLNEISPSNSIGQSTVFGTKKFSICRRDFASPMMIHQDFTEYINDDINIIDLTDTNNFIKLSTGKIPLFKDQFSEDDLAICSKIYQFDGQNYILKKAFSQMQEGDFLNIFKVDKTYGSIFDLMLKQAFRDNKHFIVARFKSRANFDEAIQFSFYNIYSVIKLIFRKQNEHYVNRFNKNCAITILDPDTKKRLIDEVEFYMIENPYLNMIIPRNKPISLEGLRGVYIGSDYNFINSSELRKTIFSNCIEEDRQRFLKFQEFKALNFHVRRELEGTTREEESSPNDQIIDNHINFLSYKAYIDSQNHFKIGVYQGAYIFTRIGTLYLGLKSLAQKDSKIAINIFSVLLPFVQLLHDHHLSNLFKKQEKLSAKIIKFLLAVIYLAVLVAQNYSWAQQAFQIICVVYPFITGIYSFLLLNCCKENKTRIQPNPNISLDHRRSELQSLEDLPIARDSSPQQSQEEEEDFDPNEDPYIRNMRRAMSYSRHPRRIELVTIPEVPEDETVVIRRQPRVTTLLELQQTDSLADLVENIQQDDLNQMRSRIQNRRSLFSDDPILGQNSQAVQEIEMII